MFILGIGGFLGYLVILGLLEQEEDAYQAQLDRKIADAEMVLYYEITRDRPLRIRLLPEDQEIKIISHLNVPRIEPHDNLREYLYGLRVELVDDHDMKLWEHVYWEKTRVTKIEEVPLFAISPEFQEDLDRQDIPETLWQRFSDDEITLSDQAAVHIVESGSAWTVVDDPQTYIIRREKSRLKVYEKRLVDWEKAFYLDDTDEMPTDNRLTTVFLSGLLQDDVPDENTSIYLKISLVSEEHDSAVVRCYRRVERPPEDRDMEWQQLTRETREMLAESNIYSIDMLTQAEKQGLMAYQWQRVLAEGKSGKDYHLRSVYLSQPLVGENIEDTEFGGFLANPWRFASVNVRGRGRLKVEISPMNGPEAQGPVQFSITRFDATGQISWEEKSVTFPLNSLDGSGEIVLNVPPGVHTYSIQPSSARFLRFYVDRFPEMFIGRERPVYYSARDWYPIEPAVHRATYYRSLGMADSPFI